ncbi:unnamed protein product [Fusarium venenatum]|uniref:Uncharacterized protein n=1 Tax=Fusarium venenatum TaxID=56646 RepID=A0A2L2T282_9HYPO|nr:uncharacterized protein FVRRES_00260 [Fusarium venenatum]CEI63748.1 unnamed protein product [Fusarium venenatum]
MAPRTTIIKEHENWRFVLHADNGVKRDGMH